MKKTYENPTVEKIAFQYRDQVVVASGTTCPPIYANVDTTGDKVCDSGNKDFLGYNQ